MTLRVAIVTDDPGWHGKRLREAFTERGVYSRYVSLPEAQLELNGVAQVILPGFETELPDAVFVRGIPGGSLEQVVFNLNVLHALTDLGVLVYNDGRAIERSVDKSLTTVRLCQAGVPTPPTWVCSNLEMARTITDRETANGNLLICKPLFGSQGKGISLVHNSSDLPEADSVHHVWYLQQFVAQAKDLTCDWRVFVIAGQAVAAMRRSTSGWLANVAQGGRCQAAVPEGELKRFSEAAVSCLDMDYAGVDLMCDRDGRWWVIEINSIPAWKGLQSVTAVNIAGCLADDLLHRCKSSELHEAAQ